MTLFIIIPVALVGQVILEVPLVQNHPKTELNMQT